MSFENYGKQTTLVGPWGGQEGHCWDDGVHSTVRQLEIAHGSGIDSIRIEYETNGRSVWSEIHGGHGGSKIDKVRLNYPDEYLTSVHGYYGSMQQWGPVLIRSLTFQTNRGTYGPFGVEHGTRFAFPEMHGKIVGFVGKSGWYLDAIGVYLESLHSTVPNSQPLHNTVPNPQPLQKTVPSNAYNSQQFFAYEYSMIQRSLGTNYDLIVAVKQKDAPFNNSPIILSPNISHDFTKQTVHQPKKTELQHGTEQPKKTDVPRKTEQPKIQEIGSDVPKKMEKKIERVPTKYVEGVVTSGPWGGNGGSLFDDGVYDGIREIKLSRNVCVVSIAVCYDKNGLPVWGSKNGGSGSFKKDKIVFDHPSEILTHITGHFGPAMKMGPNVIKSLTFHTTKCKHGPYGEEQGEFFSTKLREGSMIVGFHGRKGLFLDAIGVHALEGKVKPAASTSHNNSSASDSTSKSSTHEAPKKSVSFASTSPSKSSNQTALVPKKPDNAEWPFKIGKKGQNDEAIQRLVKDPAPYGPGPWGGEGGKPWDDGVFTGIKQIVLTIADAICCLEIEYDRNGQSVWSVKHGAATGGHTANRVKLDYPNEVLTCLSGYYSPIKKEQGTKVIQSLTFHTSRKKYGPFGEELGTHFASGTTEGKVVGFHGRSSKYLDAIGVHMQHWLGNKRSAKPPPLMKIFS